METLLSIFAEIDDPRDHTAQYLLSSMLFIALAATLCGAKACTEIADYAEANLAELSEIIDLPGRTPSHDSFSRLFRLLDPDQLERALQRFVQAIRQGLGLGPASGVVAVDAKRMRRGYERGRACVPPLMVGIWDAETRLSLAACANTSGNEVAASLQALKMVALTGCTVTADALHCHPAMAQTICAQGGEYVLKLKANHGPLWRAARAAFAEADAAGTLKAHETTEHGHDRSERRRGSVVPAPANAPDFPGLAAFGRIETERRANNGKLTQTTHYVVMSKRLPAWRMMSITRRHWGIENHLHWQLDVVFHEDDARTRKDHAPGNLAVIRRMALDMLRAHPDKRSIARKMRMAVWSKAFFQELFSYVR
jgi:predicted transposase YbfD/YdcC